MLMSDEREALTPVVGRSGQAPARPDLRQVLLALGTGLRTAGDGDLSSIFEQELRQLLAIRAIRLREVPARYQARLVTPTRTAGSIVLDVPTSDPRIQAVLEDLFRSEGSEIYLKSIFHYVPQNQPCTFEYLTLAARRRGEVLLGIQRYVDDASQKYGIVLNPEAAFRRTPFVAGPKDRLIVLAEDDG